MSHSVVYRSRRTDGSGNAQAIQRPALRCRTYPAVIPRRRPTSHRRADSPRSNAPLVAGANDPAHRAGVSDLDCTAAAHERARLLPPRIPTSSDARSLRGPGAAGRRNGTTRHTAFFLMSVDRRGMHRGTGQRETFMDGLVDVVSVWMVSERKREEREREVGRAWLGVMAEGDTDKIGTMITDCQRRRQTSPDGGAKFGQVSASFYPRIASLFGLREPLLRPDLRSPQPSRAAAVKEARRAPRSGAQRPGRPRARRHPHRSRTTRQLSRQTIVTSRPPATGNAVVRRLGADLAAIAVRF